MMIQLPSENELRVVRAVEIRRGRDLETGGRSARGLIARFLVSSRRIGRSGTTLNGRSYTPVLPLL
jgi:hypothetical protein